MSGLRLSPCAFTGGAVIWGKPVSQTAVRVSGLATAGVQPKTARELARHSTIIVVDRYTHVGLNDVAGALNVLPALPRRELI